VIFRGSLLAGRDAATGLAASPPDFAAAAFVVVDGRDGRTAAARDGRAAALRGAEALRAGFVAAEADFCAGLRGARAGRDGRDAAAGFLRWFARRGWPGIETRTSSIFFLFLH
jgi:hypothetical protein